MSFSENNIPFGVKASNLASVANFSSTLDDSYILIIANNCNVPVDNGNSYDTIYNNFHNAALFGVNASTAKQEAYIGIRKNDLAHKIAKFNSDSISLDVNTIINGNLLPSISSNYDLGAFINKWKSLYLSDSVYASHIYGDGSGITNLDLSANSTDEVKEGSSNLYYTDQRVSDIINVSNIVIYDALNSLSNFVIEKAVEVANNIDFTRLSIDIVKQGTSNKFIIDNIYDDDLYIDGSLIASNLIILGSTSTINNNVYNSEKIEIVNDSAIPGPALSIIQYGLQPTELFNASFRGQTRFVLKSQGDVGIGVTNPTSRLHVAGDVRATSFIGSGANLTNVNLRDRTTSVLQEGSNLYFTSARVGIIAHASNQNVSNYVSNTAQMLMQSFDNSMSHTSNYIINTSNTLHNFVISKTSLLETFLGNTSNNLQNVIDSVYIDSYEQYSNLSNYILQTRQTIKTNYDEQQNVNILLQSRIDNKEDIIIGAASTIKTNNLAGNRVVISGISGKIGASSVSTTELASLSGVTANVQGQLYATNERISNLTADQIQNGNINKFIVNNEYDDYLYVKKGIYTSNLNVFDNITYINTNTVSASNFQIINDDAHGPSLTIQHNVQWYNILEVYNTTIPVFTITNNNNVGIGITNPTEKLEVHGTIRGTNFAGDGSNLFNVNLKDKSTSELREGSNLYFTTERVEGMINASNAIMSNIMIGNIIKYNERVSQDLQKELRTDIQVASYSNQEYADSLYMDAITFTSFKVAITSNEISNRISYIIDDVQQYVTKEIFSTLNLSNIDCNVLLQGFTTLDRRISTLTTDQIRPGIHNTFIIDNVYDHDLTVTGKLTVSMLEVTDLGMVYEAADGSMINSDIMSYIDYMSSNVYFTLSDGINRGLIQEINDRITSLNSDDIIQTDNAHNKFIIDNVYDNDLTVIGKLTVNMLEVTDLGLVYESDDGSAVNSDIKSYINYIASNFYPANLNNFSNYFVTRISQLTTDDINQDTTRNRFIVDNVYDNNLTVIGKLTVGSLEVIDMEVVYTSSNGSNINSDIKTYIEYVTSNLYNSTFANFDGSMINADQIKPGVVNNFIVNNVYDNDLTVTGKLTVNSLEVIDVGIVYQTSNGSNINSDLKSYVNYITSNVYEELYAYVAISAQNISQTSNQLNNQINNLNVAQQNLQNSLQNITIQNKNTDQFIEGSSNLFYNVERISKLIDGSNSITIAYVNEKDRILNNRIIENADALYTIIINKEFGISNFVRSLNTDQIANGNNNKFIVNDVYNGDLDVLGTVQSTSFIGDGHQLYNVNINDKSTSELAEGSNLYFTTERAYTVAKSAIIASSNTLKINIGSFSNFSNFFEEFKYDVGNHVLDIIINLENSLDWLYDINESLSSELVKMKNTMYNMTLDNIYQGSNYQYIVNNMINNNLLVNGTLTVRDIRILDVDSEYYNDIYNSNLKYGYSNFNIRTNDLYIDSLNMSNIAASLINKMLRNFSNTVIKDIDNDISDIQQDIIDLRESQYHISLDTVVQGDKNKYIVDGIYNNSLVVNGTLMVRDIRIIDIDNNYYTDVYNSNLYKPESLIYTQPSYTISTNVSNIAVDLIGKQTNEINVLKADIQSLTESLAAALQRIATLENMLG
jgi:hypothetical protein